MTDKQNYRQASIELEKVTNFIMTEDVSQLLNLCGMRDTVTRMLQQKRRLLRDAIVTNILDFLFLRRTNKMMYEDRLMPLHTLI